MATKKVFKKLKPSITFIRQKRRQGKFRLRHPKFGKKKELHSPMLPAGDDVESALNYCRMW